MTHILTRKCAHLKGKLSNAQKENEKLKIDNDILFKNNHCMQESHFNHFEQLKLRRKTTTTGVISFDQTQLENENKVF